MSEHTPGPWVWSKAGTLLLASDRGKRVIVLGIDTSPGAADPFQGDCALIAAAPETKAQRDELLALLQEIVSAGGMLDYCDCRYCTITRKAREVVAGIAAAEAAIAKVKGG